MFLIRNNDTYYLIDIDNKVATSCFSNPEKCFNSTLCKHVFDSWDSLTDSKNLSREEKIKYINKHYKMITKQENPEYWL